MSAIHVLVIALVLLPGVVSAQDAPRLCDQPVPPPARLPAADSGPIVYALGLCFDAQGNVSAIDPETYLFYIRLRPSQPSQDVWNPYDEEVRNTMLSDFRRLWDTGFLDDLSIEATDYVLPNGVIGKVITYHLEERERVKQVSFEGSSRLDRTKIDETLRDRGLDLRLDSFLDRNLVSRVARVVKEMMVEKGFVNATVTPSITSVAGGPKLAKVTFVIDDGPRTAIRDVEFVGNRAFADDVLGHAMKSNRAEDLLSRLRGLGTFNDAKFADDAQSVEDYYRDHGYVNARVGQPVLRPLDQSADGHTRWVQLRIPITEGERYRLGTLTFAGNALVTSEQLRGLVKLKTGDWYSQGAIRDALNKAREVYGAAGYMEFVALPEMTPAGPHVIDVVIRVNEGPRYYVNRITFTGNTLTRDSVIRRELRLVEGGVFDTAALKDSVRRLNQLGYFKPLKGTDQELHVEKSASRSDAVDIRVAVEEQNRNQLQFGAGMSQYEGAFGSITYTTANFLGRGETVTVTGQRGSRSSIYQLAFTEPYVFDRPITGGLDLFSRKTDFLTGANVVGYSEVRSGVNVTAGRPLFNFSRMFLTYGYEVVDTAVSDDLLKGLDSTSSVGVPVFNPFLDEGRHIESRVTPSFVHNTVGNPFTPRSGRKVSLNAPVAGGLFGGTTNYIRPELEIVQYVPHTKRTALGVRLNGGFVRPYGTTRALPYYLRYFLGGEYQIRGVDIRTVGPTDSGNRAIGGDKFVLFNAEYYVDLFGPVRALLFHDAGQAFRESERIDLRRLRTSSGVELRVIVPMLNVPFRLIYAWNTYRDTFQPARTFKFAVGTTF
jgi:outer membrane protein insertion porin family